MSIPTLFFSLFTLTGLVIAGFGIKNVIFAKESAQWPSVQGTILDSKFLSSGRKRSSVKPSIKYTYQLDGINYTNDLIAFGMENASGGQSFAAHFVAKYPEGKVTTVYYNPASPGISVLEPGISKRSFILFAFGGLFALFGISFSLLHWLFQP